MSWPFTIEAISFLFLLLFDRQHLDVGDGLPRPMSCPPSIGQNLVGEFRDQSAKRSHRVIHQTSPNIWSGGVVMVLWSNPSEETLLRHLFMILIEFSSVITVCRLFDWNKGLKNQAWFPDYVLGIWVYCFMRCLLAYEMKFCYLNV